MAEASSTASQATQPKLITVMIYLQLPEPNNVRVFENINPATITIDEVKAMLSDSLEWKPSVANIRLLHAGHVLTPGTRNLANAVPTVNTQRGDRVVLHAAVTGPQSNQPPPDPQARHATAHLAQGPRPPRRSLMDRMPPPRPLEPDAAYLAQFGPPRNFVAQSVLTPAGTNNQGIHGGGSSNHRQIYLIQSGDGPWGLLENPTAQESNIMLERTLAAERLGEADRIRLVREENDLIAEMGETTRLLSDHNPVHFPALSRRLHEVSRRTVEIHDTLRQPPRNNIPGPAAQQPHAAMFQQNQIRQAIPHMHMAAAFVQRPGQPLQQQPADVAYQNLQQAMANMTVQPPHTQPPQQNRQAVQQPQHAAAAFQAAAPAPQQQLAMANHPVPNPNQRPIPDLPQAPPAAQPPPAAAPAQQQPAGDANAELANIITSMLRQVWLLVRVFGLIYLLTRGASSRRTFLILTVTAVFLLANAGIFGERPLERFRARFEEFLGGEDAVRARERQEELEAFGRGEELPSDEDMARRRQLRQRRGIWARLAGWERNVTLFLASLYPGVGERQVAARAREQDLQQLDAEIDGELAELDARAERREAAQRARGPGEGSTGVQAGGEGEVRQRRE